MTPFTILLSLLLLVSTVSADDPLKGVWLTGEDNTKVETYQKGGKWFGKIVSSDNPKATMGMDILRGFELTEGVWKGKLFAPKRGKIVAATIKPSKDQLVIAVSAGIMSRTLHWKRGSD